MEIWIPLSLFSHINQFSLRNKMFLMFLWEMASLSCKWKLKITWDFHHNLLCFYFSVARENVIPAPVWLDGYVTPWSHNSKSATLLISSAVLKKNCEFLQRILLKHWYAPWGQRHLLVVRVEILVAPSADGWTATPVLAAGSVLSRSATFSVFTNHESHRGQVGSGGQSARQRPNAFSTRKIDRRILLKNF